MISTRWLCVTALATACSGKGSDSSGGETPTATFSVSGMVLDMGVPPLGDVVTKNCTVSLLDPTKAVSGGTPTVLATTQSVNGEYRIEGITEKPALGLALLVSDCGNTGDVPTNTGLAVESYQDLEDGAEITDNMIYRIGSDLGQHIDEDLVKAGYTGKGIVPDGALLASILVDDAPITPAPNATLTCTTCGASYFYFDSDRADSGYFMTAGKMNTVTDPFAASLVLVPAAPIYQYTADDGGANTYETRTLGSQQGSVLVARFTAI